MSKEKKYIIELNQRQAELLSWALDTFPRLIEGQGHAFQDLMESAWEKRCKKVTGGMMDKKFEGGWYKMREDAETIVREIKHRFWNLAWNSDNGIHYDDSADILWDIYQVLRHEIWKNRPEPKSKATVDAFPATQFGKEPLAKVTSSDKNANDLALTWEDISKIDAIILDVNNELAVDYSKEIDRRKFYEEVLRRFNEQRKCR